MVLACELAALLLNSDSIFVVCIVSLTHTDISIRSIYLLIGKDLQEEKGKRLQKIDSVYGIKRFRTNRK